MYPRAILNPIYQITVVCCRIIALEILKGQFFGVPEGFGDNGYRRHGKGNLGICRC